MIYIDNYPKADYYIMLQKEPSTKLIEYRSKLIKIYLYRYTTLRKSNNQSQRKRRFSNAIKEIALFLKEKEDLNQILAFKICDLENWKNYINTIRSLESLTKTIYIFI